MIATMLHAFARHARAMLVLGLVLGVAMPSLALAMRSWIPHMIALLLFLAALRVGHRAVLGALGDLWTTLGALLVLQLLLPVALALLFALPGWSSALALGIVLMAAASPISGSPNLTIMAGHDPAPALRMLIFGTALLPVTVLPVFWLMPAIEGGDAILAVAARLLGVIALAVGAGFLLRRFWLRAPGPDALLSIDGISAVLLGAVVIGLMSAVGPALTGDPAGLLVNLAVAFAVNFGLQIVVTGALRRLGRDRVAVPYGIVAGNRNIALFLTALPASVTDPLLLFIGCYQVPMYLTPLLLRRFHAARPKS